METDRAVQSEVVAQTTAVLDASESTPVVTDGIIEEEHQAHTKGQSKGKCSTEESSAELHSAKAPSTAAATKKVDTPFIPKQPVRVEHVQNAVSFLSHPKVKGSPVKFRRAFLERKGLTGEEIDEAFRRVPDSLTESPSQTPASATASSTVAAQSAPTLTGPASQGVGATPQPGVPALQTSGPASQPGPEPQVTGLQRPSWSSVALAVAVIGAAGAGGALAWKKVGLPWLKAWVKGLAEDEGSRKAAKSGQESEAQEEAVAAEGGGPAAAAPTSELATAVRDLTSSVNSALGEVKAVLEETKKAKGVVQEGGDGAITMADLRRELRTMASVMSDFSPTAAAGLPQRAAIAPPSAPAPAAAQPPHPKSYMEIMEMVQRGEKPPGIKEIDDKPPNPNQPLTESRAAPLPKPWESQSGGPGAKPSSYSIPPAASHPPAYASSSYAPAPSSAGSWWRPGSSPMNGYSPPPPSSTPYYNYSPTSPSFSSSAAPGLPAGGQPTYQSSGRTDQQVYHQASFPSDGLPRQQQPSFVSELSGGGREGQAGIAPFAGKVHAGEASAAGATGEVPKQSDSAPPPYYGQAAHLNQGEGSTAGADHAPGSTPWGAPEGVAGGAAPRGASSAFAAAAEAGAARRRWTPPAAPGVAMPEAAAAIRKYTAAGATGTETAAGGASGPQEGAAAAPAEGQASANSVGGGESAGPSNRSSYVVAGAAAVGPADAGGGVLPSTQTPTAALGGENGRNGSIGGADPSESSTAHIIRPSVDSLTPATQPSAGTPGGDGGAAAAGGSEDLSRDVLE